MTERPSSVELPVDNLRGAMWMSGSVICSAVSTVLIKQVTLEMPAIQLAFFRCAFGLLFVVPFILRDGWGVYRTDSPGTHIFRGFCVAVAMVLGIYAVEKLPLATAVALLFTRPLFMIVVGILFLHERVHWRRGLATVAGFVGVVILVGPTDLNSLPAALSALGAAAFMAGSMAAVRKQAAVDGPATLMVWFGTTSTIFSIFPALFVWQMPGAGMTWVWLAAIGIVATFGQYFMIHAFTHGEATVMNPIDYVQILITAVLGYMFFSEVPTLSTWIGAAVISAATLYILVRESRFAPSGP